MTCESDACSTLPGSWLVVALGGVVLVGWVLFVGPTEASSQGSEQASPPARETGLAPVSMQIDELAAQQSIVLSEEQESFFASMEAQEASGWTAISIGGGRTGSVAWEFNRPDDPARLGEWTVVVDEDGSEIGVWVHPVGFIESEGFDPATLDWIQLARDRGARDVWIDEQIERDAALSAEQP